MYVCTHTYIYIYIYIGPETRQIKVRGSGERAIDVAHNMLSHERCMYYSAMIHNVISYLNTFLHYYAMLYYGALLCVASCYITLHYQASAPWARSGSARGASTASSWRGPRTPRSDYIPMCNIGLYMQL